MSDSPFAAPAAPGDGITWADLKGCLLLIEPISVETDINTSYGMSDAVRANVVVLDGEEKGERYDNTLVFPKLLQSQLSSKIGQKVLGRLGQGQQKPGQSPPWILSEATEQDQQVGLAYLQSNETAQPDQPKQEATVPF